MDVYKTDYIDFMSKEVILCSVLYVSHVVEVVWNVLDSLKEIQSKVLRSMEGDKDVVIIRHIGTCHRTGADATSSLGLNEDPQVYTMWKEM